MRKEWPPVWFPLRPRKIRFDLDVPSLADDSHYCLVLYNDLYWFSTQTRRSGPLAVDVLTDQPYRGVLIVTDDRLATFEVVHKLFDGQTARLRTNVPYSLSLRRQHGQ